MLEKYLIVFGFDQRPLTFLPLLYSQSYICVAFFSLHSLGSIGNKSAYITAPWGKISQPAWPH